MEEDNRRGLAVKGGALWHLGCYDEAEKIFHRVTELYPEHGEAYGYLVSMHRDRKQYEDGLRACREYLEKVPDSWWLRRLHVTLLRALDREDEAAQAAGLYLEETRPEGQDPNWCCFLAAAGRHEEARRQFAEFDWAETDFEFFAALVQAVMGDRQASLSWLRKAADEGYFIPLGSHLAPDREILRGMDSFAVVEKLIRTKR